MPVILCLLIDCSKPLFIKEYTTPIYKCGLSLLNKTGGNNISCSYHIQFVSNYNIIYRFSEA